MDEEIQALSKAVEEQTARKLSIEDDHKLKVADVATALRQQQVELLTVNKQLDEAKKRVAEGKERLKTASKKYVH